MNIQEATRALFRIYGKKARYRYDKSAPTAEEREAVRATIPALRATRDAILAAREERRRVLLADTLYVALVADEKAATKALDEAQRTYRRYRVTILTEEGIFNQVRVEGDNWQDAVDKARAQDGKQK